jgi:hypothetical protein
MRFHGGGLEASRVCVVSSSVALGVWVMVEAVDW